MLQEGGKKGEFSGHVEFEILLRNPTREKQVMEYRSEERRRGGGSGWGEKCMSLHIIDDSGTV